MSLSLASDKEITLQSHLDELSIRLGRLLALFVLMMIIGWYFIDQILKNYLSILSPCSDCIAVYSPTEWVSLRWLSIVLLGICLSLPFIFREVIVFCSPGMMEHERKWLRQLLTWGTFFIAFTVSLTLIVILPAWFLSAEEAGFIEGVTPSYSAASMLELALVISYIEVIIILSTIAAILLRRFGLAEGEELFSWRFRLHGIAMFSMWLIVPSAQDALLTLGIFIEIVFVELSFSKINRGKMALPFLNSSKGVLDAEAKLRRIGIIDCSCAGACPKLGVETLPEYFLGMEVKGLCLSDLERDLIIETVQMNRLSDVIIGGCSSEPLPKKFKENLEYLNCNLRGISLMDVETLREGQEKNKGLQLQMSLASLTDPWIPEKTKQRQEEVLKHYSSLQKEPIIINSNDVELFGLTLSAEEVYCLDS
jgi:Sec-independent protein secretion pathway component TatC